MDMFSFVNDFWALEVHNNDGTHKSSFVTAADESLREWTLYLMAKQKFVSAAFLNKNFAVNKFSFNKPVLRARHKKENMQLSGTKFTSSSAPTKSNGR